MSDPPDGQEPNQQRQPVQQQQACSTCGHITIAMPVLDTREGKSYRLFRCDPCQSLTWFEEQ